MLLGEGANAIGKDDLEQPAPDLAKSGGHEAVVTLFDAWTIGYTEVTEIWKRSRGGKAWKDVHQYCSVQCSDARFAIRYSVIRDISSRTFDILRDAVKATSESATGVVDTTQYRVRVKHTVLSTV
jgi:hypothetical protein